MKKKLLAVIIIVSVAAVVGSMAIWYRFFRYPNTLALGEDPALLLPMYDFSNNSYIYGYGQLTPDTFHNGIDFGVNRTTAIVAPHAAYVEAVNFWYNDKGGHWQTNVRFWLNHQWKIEIAFESWALNETYGQLQADAILVNPGQYVEVNQTFGNLLYHGTGAHIHFTISSNNVDLCPYTFFTPTSQSIFAAQFALVNYTAHWCM